MTIRTAFSDFSSAHAFARPKCPRCGDVLLVAEESEFGANGRIRHSWSCDSCGHEFRTSISLRRR
jgi:hypothetical protein